jgi:hypothetical protein
MDCRLEQYGGNDADLVTCCCSDAARSLPQASCIHTIEFEPRCPGSDGTAVPPPKKLAVSMHLRTHLVILESD